MACCDWQTFKDSFLAAWRKKGAGEALVDWQKAERDWRRYHCTGGEAAKAQLQALAKEGEYLWLEQANSLKMRRKNSGDGGAMELVPA